MSIKFSLTFEKNPFVKLLQKYNYKFKAGDILAGKVISFEKKATLIDIGANTLAYLPISEISFFESFLTKDIFQSSDLSEFLLFSYNETERKFIVSISKLKSILTWKRLKQLANENFIFSSKVEKSTKQGKIVNIQGFKAFVTNSHLPKYYRRKYLKKLNLPLKFLELSETKNEILFTCKLAYFKNQSNFLKVQQSILGTITTIQPYGLFVNIYGLKGLLHISEISEKRINDLNKVFKKGQLINVRILYINFNTGRISLSVKQFD
jgi:small subunit ribosomal protein S1